MGNTHYLHCTIEEIEKGNYQTLQQIADMIQEKFEIHVSIMAVSRLLKKTKSES
jgi:transposase